MRPVPTVLAVGLAQASLGLVLGSLGPYLLLLADELDRPRGELGWLASGFGAGLVVLAAAGQRLLRLAPGRVLRASAVAVAAGAVVLALTPSLPLAAAGALGFGLGGAGVVLTTPALLAGPGLAGRVSAVTGASAAGGLLGPVLVGATELLTGSGALALLVPAPVLLALAAGWRDGPTTGLGPPGGRRPGPDGGAGAGGRMVVALAWWQVVLAVAAEFCYLLWGAARLRDAGASPAVTALLSSGFLVGMAVGRLAGARLAGCRGALAACAAVAGTGTALVVAAVGPGLVATGLLLAGLGVSLLYPLTLASLVAAPGLSLRAATSLGALASGTAVLTAPTMLGWLDGTMSLRVAFLLPLLLLALLLVTATVSPWLTRRPTRRRSRR